MCRYMFLALIELSLLHFVLSQINPGFPYGSEKVRGVNLGGWLVLEVSVMMRTVKVSN
jgi:glucan 1,3-beta-glucosidase